MYVHTLLTFHMCNCTCVYTGQLVSSSVKELVISLLIGIKLRQRYVTKRHITGSFEVNFQQIQ